MNQYHNYDRNTAAKIIQSMNLDQHYPNCKQALDTLINLLNTPDAPQYKIDQAVTALQDKLPH